MHCAQCYAMRYAMLCAQCNALCNAPNAMRYVRDNAPNAMRYAMRPTQCAQLTAPNAMRHAMRHCVLLQIECIEEAVAREVERAGSKYGSEGAKVGCVRISSIVDLSNMASFIFKKYYRAETDEKGRVTGGSFDPPENVQILVDLARALSEQPAKEPMFFGTIETLTGKSLSSFKYEGGEVTWAKPPSVLIASNGRPIEHRADKNGRLLRNLDETIAYTPKCYLSAHRIMGHVFTVKDDRGEYVLLRDVVSDELAVKVRTWEVAAQRQVNAEIEGAPPPNMEQRFLTMVMCDFTPVAPHLLPKAEWTPYTELLRCFEFFAPEPVTQFGPGNT